MRHREAHNTVAGISPSWAWSKGLITVGWVWWRHQRVPFQPCLGSLQP